MKVYLSAHCATILSGPSCTIYYVVTFVIGGSGDIDHESRDITNFYTVEDVVEQLGFGWYQLGITLFSGSLWVSVMCNIFGNVMHHVFIKLIV